MSVLPAESSHFLDELLLGLSFKVFIKNRFEVNNVLLVNMVWNTQLPKSLHLLKMLEFLLQYSSLVEPCRTCWGLRVLGRSTVYRLLRVQVE